MIQLKLDENKAYEVYKECVDYNTRKRATYCPIFALHIVMDLVEKSLNYMAEEKVSETKALSRKIRESIRDFRQTYKDTLIKYGFDIYDSMLQATADFQHAIVDDMFLHQQTFVRQFLNLNKTEYDISVPMATLFVAKEFCFVTKEFIEDTKAEINRQLNKNVTSVSERRSIQFDDADSEVADYFILTIEKLADALGFPKSIEKNQDLKNAKIILRKDLNAITFE